MAQDPPFPRMLHFINAAMHVDRRLTRGKGRVKVGLADIAAEAVYGFQSCCSVDAERVGTDTDDRAILLVRTVVGEVAGAPIGVVR
jgi:hypothetical protein